MLIIPFPMNFRSYCSSWEYLSHHFVGTVKIQNRLIWGQCKLLFKSFHNINNNQQTLGKRLRETNFFWTNLFSLSTREIFPASLCLASCITLKVLLVTTPRPFSALLRAWGWMYNFSLFIWYFLLYEHLEVVQQFNLKVTDAFKVQANSSWGPDWEDGSWSQ